MKQKLLKPTTQIFWTQNIVDEDINEYFIENAEKKPTTVTKITPKDSGHIQIQPKRSQQTITVIITCT